ncbi:MULTISPECIES: neutral zinc metallopeptidase [unclassified Amycolatopsis]|uniref:neutral zinc metallopeptidase n=1 Tax=unclassified Amycolatopsis TaxID=2618356 RepID=UPI001FF1BC9D|nr:neutral zinc metallopeptidase [Amycolatopsis sp. FBCC-B4732]UOX85711.1 neutral zinc metallopeptidase [Amycolatopsis sp. FBCC-B4732]
MIHGGGRRALVALLAVAAVAVSGCNDKGGSGSGPVRDNGAGSVSGLPVTHFESGLKPDAPSPDLDVRNADGGEDDKLATAAIADVQTYWGEHLKADFGQQFEPVKSLLSYDAQTDTEKTGCGSVKKLVNAFYCPVDDSVAWDRGVLLPMLRQRFGPMSVVVVLAHEFGHAVQYRLGDKAGITKSTPTVVKEQQADCFAGGYFRWVAEDKSKFYRVSTSEGLNQVMASMFLIRDQAGTSAADKGAHGTAFDRTYAFQAGFEKGPKECAAMNADNVKARLTERPFDKGDTGKGDAKFTDQAVELLKKSLDEAFKGAGVAGPEITDGGSCQTTPPASYCPGDNTVSIDLAKLSQLAQPIDREAEMKGEDPGGMGDFAAFSEVASRYALGIQKGVGASIDNANAGLRTACLVGAWAAFTNRPGDLRLSAGDLDEAIADLLQPESLVSADVNGKRPDSGFDRVESLRKGYLEGSSVCSKQYG